MYQTWCDMFLIGKCDDLNGKRRCVCQKGWQGSTCANPKCVNYTYCLNKGKLLWNINKILQFWDFS